MIELWLVDNYSRKITVPSNKILLAGTILANNLLLAVNPQGPFQDPSRTLLGPLKSHYGRYGYINVEDYAWMA